MKYTQQLIDQATEVKDTRDNGYVAARVSEIAPGGFFKTQVSTAKGVATEVTVDCEHDSSIGVVVRWYDDGSRRVRFEQFNSISRADAEHEIVAAIEAREPAVTIESHESWGESPTGSGKIKLSSGHTFGYVFASDGEVTGYCTNERGQFITELGGFYRTTDPLEAVKRVISYIEEQS